MPRAYTKSGSIEKYESGQWATPVWSSSNKGVKGTITGPDSNGNYTVNAPSGYVSGGSEISCTTKYGGKTKVFSFKSKTLNDYQPYIDFGIDTSTSAGDTRYITLWASFNENLPRDVTIHYQGSVPFSGRFTSNDIYYSGTESIKDFSYVCGKGKSSFKQYIGNLPQPSVFHLDNADFSKITYTLSW